MSGVIEASVVMPCLNEADTVGTCVTKAVQALREAGISGEVVVADNGSQDGSQRIATAAGARVIHVADRGYGAALMGGIEASGGQFVIMGDADDSYDFLALPAFIDKLREGFDLVQGCRLPRGGGRVLPGAMPFLHRWIGNPLLSWLVRRMFRISISDVYCGMRGFRRDLYDRLDLRSSGMEFATEMIIRSGLQGASMAEVPITLHPDGRQQHGPHLRTIRDGWRTLKLFLVFSPRWAFFRPGLFLLGIAVLGYVLALPQVRLFGAALDVHTLLVASLCGLMGWQSVLLATLAKIFAGREGMMPRDPRLEQITVERGLVFGLSAMVVGLLLIGIVVARWYQLDFGRLDYPYTMRLVVPGVTAVGLGFQTMMAALMAGVLQMHRGAPRETPAGGEPAVHRNVELGEVCCDPAWEEAYNRFESPEEEIAKFMRRLHRLGVDRLSRRSVCVELFCGRGGGLVALERLGFSNLTGVDLSESLLLQYRGPAELHLADCRALPLESDSVDAVIVQGGLHHLPALPEDLEGVLAEAQRVLRDGGRFYVVEPWSTPFLTLVHLITDHPLVRKLYRKGDALATMTEHERETYERWLGQPQRILQQFTQHFDPELQKIGWGKLHFVGRARSDKS